MADGESLSNLSFLADGGEMGALIRAHDWGSTPIGPPEGWPSPLRTSIRVMLNTGHPMYIFWGPDGACFYNDAYRQSIGPERHPGSLGQPAREVWAEIWDVIGPQVEQVMSGRGATWNENHLIPITRNGRREDVYWTYSYGPIDDPEAESGIGGVLVVCTETTATVLAEARAALDRQRLTEMFEQAPGFMAMLEGPEHRFALTNRAYGRLIGDRDVLGKTVAESLPDAVAQGYLDLLDTVYRTGQAYNTIGASYVAPGAGGEPDRQRFLDFVYQPITDANGRVTGIFVEGSDVTERMEAQVALGESEGRYRRIVEGAADFAIVGLDEAGSITSWNKGAEHLLGFREEEVLGRPGAIFFTPEDAAAGAPDRELERARADGQALNERWHVRNDGTRFWGSGLLMRLDDHGFLKMFRDRTAEHEGEQQLRESERRFRTLADAIGEVFYLTDLSTRKLVYVSAAFEEIWGRPATELFERDRAYVDAIHPDDRARAHDAYRAQESGTPTEVEYRILRPDGTVRWILDRSFPVLDADGRPAQAAGIAEDVTQRREAEAALARSEEQLRLAIEAADIGLWDVDVVRDTLFWPARVKAMFGISADRPVTMDDFYSALHPDDAEATTAAYAAAADPDRRAPYDVEYRAIGKEDGVVRWVAAIGRGIFDTSGKCVRMIGTAIDISSRVKTEMRSAALVELSDRLRDLEDPAELAFAAAEILGRTLGVSRAGYGTIDPVAETITIERDWNAPGITTLAGVLHFRDYGSYIEDLKRGETVVFADAEKDPRTAATAQALKAIGAQAVVNMPVSEKSGLVALLYLNHATAREWPAEELALVREVAERTRAAIARREAEEEVRALAASLEAKVAERTGELFQAQEALRQSQKLEAMGQLTGGVAHDFNNLLTPIIGSLDLLQRRAGGSEREQRLIEGALQSAERAKTLVQRLLAFARRQPLQPRPVDVGALVQGMTDLIASTSGPQTRIAVDIAPDVPAAVADPNQLEMAILNLSVNARDAMPDGGRLSITVLSEHVGAGHRTALPSGQYVCVSIADTGVGMDEATVARAIEPFFSTKGVGKGTGLGLSMVHGLANQLGGTLVLTSRPDVGTKVELWLPATRAAATHDAGPTPLAATAATGRALLVDDEDLVRASTADMLADLGYEVCEARSAETALRRLFDGDTFDLLVTDHLMPGMTGTDLAREALSRNPQLCVLVISGYAELDGIAPDLPRLTKPFRQSDLAQALGALTS